MTLSHWALAIMLVWNLLLIGRLRRIKRMADEAEEDYIRRESYWMTANRDEKFRTDKWMQRFERLQREMATWVDSTKGKGK